MKTEAFTFEDLHFLHKELWGRLGNIQYEHIASRLTEDDDVNIMKLNVLDEITLQHFSLPLNEPCPACDYAVIQYHKCQDESYCRRCSICDFCPIVRATLRCTDEDALYEQWIYLVVHNNYEEARKIAIQIRDMEWRPENV